VTQTNGEPRPPFLNPLLFAGQMQSHALMYRTATVVMNNHAVRNLQNRRDSSLLLRTTDCNSNCLPTEVSVALATARGCISGASPVRAIPNYLTTPAPVVHACRSQRVAVVSESRVMSILEKARRDLALARADVSNAQQVYRSSVAKLRAAEERVRKLEFGLIDWEVAQASAQRRASASRP
jgi:hypothetical protein